ncbi:hypothetical protein ACFL2C_02330 [Patescibacteria group bacterium]
MLKIIEKLRKANNEMSRLADPELPFFAHDNPNHFFASEGLTIVRARETEAVRHWEECKKHTRFDEHEKANNSYSKALIVLEDADGVYARARRLRSRVHTKNNWGGLRIPDPVAKRNPSVCDIFPQKKKLGPMRGMIWNPKI